ncbi:MAG: hypothetical protein KAJ97_03245 [Acidobacteria bacterium]|nr:hypothetical protein [Acidobacteriota bacterium]
MLVYLVNASLVICHEIDSAYWHEWTLFHLPGGPEGFVAMHLVVVPLLLVGLVQVAGGTSHARWWSLAIGVAGCLGCVAHLVFLAAGDERFASPFSLALIIAFGMSSAALILAAVKTPSIPVQRTR